MAEIEQMGSSELFEWYKYWQMEPWGSYRDNIHAGLIASTLANAFMSKGKRVNYQDFMLVDRREHAKKKTTEFITWMKSVGKKKNGRK